MCDLKKGDHVKWQHKEYLDTIDYEGVVQEDSRSPVINVNTTHSDGMELKFKRISCVQKSKLTLSV